MKTFQLEELHRLRLALETIEKRCDDAEMAASRVREEVHEARMSVIMLLEGIKTIQEVGAEGDAHSWLLPGGLHS